MRESRLLETPDKDKELALLRQDKEILKETLKAAIEVLEARGINTDTLKKGLKLSRCAE